MTMERKQKILEYRERLDKTLASHDLVNEESLKSLIKNQLVHSLLSGTQEHVENIVEKKAHEVSNILEMLRSASGTDGNHAETHGMPHREWKLKQENEEYRVMYREGAEGTPFHTLLVEGYVDGPLDVCLCLAWESTLFRRWWPQFHVPPFKITAASCLQRIRIDEQLQLVRVKVAWPVSAREVILHYFELEYFQDDLVLVLLDTISDTEAVDEHTYGFTRDCIPDSKDIVRIDLVGGVVLQKVTSNRTYFRTIATMDMKIEFVPTSFINFVSRQLIGSGFKLYQKTVASVVKGDEEFGKALEDPLYVRVREALKHENKLQKGLQLEAVASENVKDNCATGLASEIPPDDVKVISQLAHCDSHEINSSQAGTSIMDHISLSEIKEENVEEETQLKENGETLNHSSLSSTVDEHRKQKKVFISPEVENALRMLDNVISMVRNREVGLPNWSGLGNQQLQKLERIATEVGSTSSGDGSDFEDSIKAEKLQNMKALGEPENSSNIIHVRHNRATSHIKEVSHNQIAPGSPVSNSTVLKRVEEVAWSSSQNGKTMEAPVLDNMSKDHEEVTIKLNGIRENHVIGGKKLKKKKQIFCCLHFYSGRN